MRRRSTLALVACAWACAGCGGLATPNAELFPPPPRDAITFWGHACVYIDVGGIGIVTDPVFERSVIPRSRRAPVPPPSSYVGARVVVISHAHDDHLSAETLRTFPAEAVVLCSPWSAKYLTDSGREVRPMRPGDVFEVGDARITAVAAHHGGSRLGTHAVADGRALGYVIETPVGTIYYSGDSDYFSGFSDVGWTFRPDVAILNVNGHLPATDAPRAAWATRAPVIIPTHWGGFKYWLFGGNKRPRDGDTLARVLGERLHVLEVGQSLPIAPASFERAKP